MITYPYELFVLDSWYAVNHTHSWKGKMHIFDIPSLFIFYFIILADHKPLTYSICILANHKPLTCSICLHADHKLLTYSICILADHKPLTCSICLYTDAASPTCNDSPCQNGATCHWSDGVIQCTCPVGFIDDTCSTGEQISWHKIVL